MTTTKKPTTGRGRPKLPAEESRTEVIRMRATKGEKTEYDQRGGDTWLRRLLARKTKD